MSSKTFIEEMHDALYNMKKNEINGAVRVLEIVQKHIRRHEPDAPILDALEDVWCVGLDIISSFNPEEYNRNYKKYILVDDNNSNENQNENENENESESESESDFSEYKSDDDN